MLFTYTVLIFLEKLMEKLHVSEFSTKNAQKSRRMYTRHISQLKTLQPLGHRCIVCFNVRLFLFFYMYAKMENEAFETVGHQPVQSTYYVSQVRSST